MVETRVGGKLYWGGEYAVVESGHTAVIMAVKRYLVAKMDFAREVGKIQSSLYRHRLLWSYQDGKLRIKSQDDYSLIIKTIELMSEYISEQGLELKEFNLNINSDLHDDEFQKYGFGSSGAVVVAVVRGMLKLYHLKDENMLVFKLACLVLLKIGNNGSMGDVASCTYGGLIAYTSFNRNQVIEALNQKTISEIVAMDWQYLKIRALKNKLNMEPIIGWTGKEAISSELVYKVGLVRNKQEYEVFLNQSETEIEKLIFAIETGDKSTFKQSIHALRQGLKLLAKISDVNIETIALSKLAEIAEKYDAAGKLSGAGGGDCGIIFSFDGSQKEEIIQDLKSQTIQYLEFI